MKKNILAAFILLISLSGGIEAQRFDQDCNPLAIPAACREISDSITRIEARITATQERLNGASPNQKPALLRTIARYNDELAAAKADLKHCMIDHGATPRELAAAELTSNLSGTATLRTTDSEARGPFEVDFDVDIRFTRNRCGVTITRFPSIKLKTDDIPGLGKVSVTVSRTGGGTGSFHPVSGAMNIPITLHFHYGTILVSDDDVTFTLTTGSVPSGDGERAATGSPLSADDRITLVGSATFRNGYLDGKLGGLLIRATISPHP